MKFHVSYWNHYRESAGKHLNDCFGNSFLWIGEAESVQGAINKAKLANNGPCFRLLEVSYLIQRYEDELVWIEFSMTNEEKEQFEIGS